MTVLFDNGLWMPILFTPAFPLDQQSCLMPHRFILICGFLLASMTAALAETLPASPQEAPALSQEERLIQARTRMDAMETGGAKRDFPSVFPEFLALAQEGNAEAQETVGRMYGVGMGVEIDRCEATYWMDKAARAGRPWAQLLLGWSYWNGDGVIRDHDLAYLWFMTAARNGRPDAADDAGILARSDLRRPSRIAALNEKLWTWRPKDQPPVRIIRLPYIWGFSLAIRIIGLTACHFPR